MAWLQKVGFQIRSLREEKLKLIWLGLGCVIAAVGVTASFAGVQVGVVSSSWARAGLFAIGLTITAAAILERSKRAWSVWPDTRAFVHQENVLESLEAQLSQGAHDSPCLAVLTGLPGVGKSWAAAEYARRYRRRYRIVWWLNAEDEASIVRDYHDLARKLDLPITVVPDAPSQEIAIATIFYLAKSNRWLLIFDNVPPPATGQGSPFDGVRRWLPKEGAGHVVVTTTDPHWGAAVQPIEVKPFSDEVGAQFLLARTGSDDTASALEVTTVLGGLPLALEQVASCVPDVITSLADFAKSFRESERLADMGAVPGHANVITALRIVFDRLTTSAPEATTLLCVGAFLSAQPIPRGMLEHAFSAAGPPLHARAERPGDLVDALTQLRRFSLVNVTNSSITFHALVQLGMRSWLRFEDERRYVERAVLMMSAAVADAASNKEALPALLPHAVIAASHAARLDAEPRAVASISLATGSHYLAIGQTAEARGLLERALAIQESLYGREHTETARTLTTLGNVHLGLGDPATARELCERALRIEEAVYGTEHPEITKTLVSLGSALFELGDPATARNLCERALRIEEAVYGTEHPEIAKTLVSLGVAHAELGDRATARELCERALRIEEAAYGPEHPVVAATLVNLGNILFELGDPATARDLCERALRIEEAFYGPEHPVGAATLVNLGNALLELGDPATARDLCERALRIEEAFYGPEHPNVAKTLASLGIAHAELGDPGTGRDYVRRALRIEEATYGPEHPVVAATLVNLANALSELGDPATARDLCERALLISESFYGLGHPETANALMTLGSAYTEVGDPATGRDYVQRALRINEAFYGPEHPEVAKTLVNLGKPLFQLGDPATAGDQYERALRIQEAFYGPEHPLVAIVLSNLGAAHSEMGDAATASELYERALRIQEAFYGRDHPVVAMVLSNLGAAHSELGDPATGRDLLQRALRIEEAFYGPQHPEVAKTLLNLGQALVELRDPTTAGDLLQRALIILEAFYGADHPIVAKTLVNLAGAFYAAGKPAPARDLCERALRIEEAFYGPDHPVLANTLHTLATALAALGKAGEAARVRRRAEPLIALLEQRNLTSRRNSGDTYDLWEEVRYRTSQSEELDVLSESASDIAVGKVTSEFLDEDLADQWWNCLTRPSRKVPYTRRSEALEEIVRPVMFETAYLVVKADDGRVYGTIKGPVTELLRLVSSASPFAFALAGTSMSWLILDKPTQEFLLVGEDL